MYLQPRRFPPLPKRVCFSATHFHPTTPRICPTSFPPLPSYREIHATEKQFDDRESLREKAERFVLRFNPSHSYLCLEKITNLYIYIFANVNICAIIKRRLATYEGNFREKAERFVLRFNLAILHVYLYLRRLPYLDICIY